MQPRRLFAGLLLAAAILAGQCPSLAADFPAKPVRLIVGYAPGGGADLVGRLVAKELGEKLGSPVVVENRPGGGTTIAAAYTATSPADGYTLFLYGMPLTLPPAVKVSFDPVKSFTAIALIAEQPAVLVAGKNVPANTLAELIALAKARPGALNFGTTGPATPTAVMMNLLMARAGIEMTNISYAGEANIMTSILGDEVQSGFMTLSTVAPQVKAGAMKALAVSTRTRAPQAPETPTVAEATGIADFDVSLWYGIVGPAGMSEAVVKVLRDGLAAVLAKPEVKQAMTEQGLIVLGPNQDFGQRIQKEVALWAALIK